MRKKNSTSYFGARLNLAEVIWRQQHGFMRDIFRRNLGGLHVTSGLSIQEILRWIWPYSREQRDHIPCSWRILLGEILSGAKDVLEKKNVECLCLHETERNWTCCFLWISGTRNWTIVNFTMVCFRNRVYFAGF